MLSDPQKRKLYDEYGEEGAPPSTTSDFACSDSGASAQPRHYRLHSSFPEGRSAHGGPDYRQPACSVRHEQQQLAGRTRRMILDRGGSTLTLILACNAVTSSPDVEQGCNTAARRRPAASREGARTASRRTRAARRPAARAWMRRRPARYSRTCSARGSAAAAAAGPGALDRTNLAPTLEAELHRGR